MGAVSGKGISAAVRGSIGEWMTDRVLDLLWNAQTHAGKQLSSSRFSFSVRVRNSDDWVRVRRIRSLKGGWTRTYRSKQFGGEQVGLTVKSNENDTHIEYVTITLDGKVIGGGRVKVPSVFVSQSGRQASIQDFKGSSLFSEFSEAELAKMSAELEYGEDSAYDLLTQERF
jgi:hypothetical protein